jgi:hypothetical protein
MRPSWLAAMPPRTATLSACPVTRMVARKALASPSWRGATLPMMALALGALKAAMPMPTMARVARTRAMPASSPSVASSAIPAAVSSMPVVVSSRDPTRSLSRPLSGLSTACITGCASRIHPVSVAERPCTTCRYTTVSTPTAVSAR